MQDKIDKLIPPPELLSYEASTAETFHELGLGFVLYRLIARGQLKPDERVLDLGSGCGQKARILTGYLSTSGSYEGLDILKRTASRGAGKRMRTIRTFVSRAPDDLYSSHYNLNGRMKATEYEFPYSDAAFDMVFCASLFTRLAAVLNSQRLPPDRARLKTSGARGIHGISIKRRI